MVEETLVEPTDLQYKELSTGLASFLGETRFRDLSAEIASQGGIDGGRIRQELDQRLVDVLGSRTLPSLHLLWDLKTREGLHLEGVVLQKLLELPEEEPKGILESCLHQFQYSRSKQSVARVAQERVERFFTPNPDEKKELTSVKIQRLEAAARLRIALEDRVLADWEETQQTPALFLLDMVYRQAPKINLDEIQLRNFEDGIIEYEGRVGNIRYLVDHFTGIYEAGRTSATDHPAKHKEKSAFLGLAITRAVFAPEVDIWRLKGPILLELEPASIHLICLSDEDYRLLRGEIEEGEGTTTEGFVADSVFKRGHRFSYLKGTVVVERRTKETAASDAERTREHERRHTISSITRGLRAPRLAGRIAGLNNRIAELLDRVGGEAGLATTSEKFQEDYVQLYLRRDLVACYLDHNHGEIISYATSETRWPQIREYLTERGGLHDYGHLKAPSERQAPLGIIVERLADLGIRNARELVEAYYERLFFGLTEKALSAYQGLEKVYYLENEPDPKRIAMAMLDPFDLEKWPALVKMVRQKHKTTSRQIELLEAWRSWHADLPMELVFKLANEGDIDQARKIFARPHLRGICSSHLDEVKKHISQSEPEFWQAETLSAFLDRTRETNPLDFDQDGRLIPPRKLLVESALVTFGQKFVKEELDGLIEETTRSYFQNLDQFLDVLAKLNTRVADKRKLAKYVTTNRDWQRPIEEMVRETEQS